jgi:3-hydroxyacyl-CoA dehydrogenase/enoyl-CoA hydratase/3-hydroxybutyryl-CoA epimerase/enoyl-CoA isomerase
MPHTSPSPSTADPQVDRPGVYLVGAGVVGRAILKAHTDADVSVFVADQNPDFVHEAVEQLGLDRERWHVSPLVRLGERLPAVKLTFKGDSSTLSTSIVIESIAERLDVKQAFFSEAEHLFGDDAVLCSNTSTLRIGAIAEPLSRPARFCGMHFFMPVDRRPAVEVIGGAKTSDSTIKVCTEHARRINKEPLAVGDGPGFVVNRLLSPYLNEAMLMLGRGISAEQIERAALAYGMPMSPLELIDLIGTRTMFDAGRVYWQSFPSRISPSPMLSALVKNKRFGHACGRGLYDYENGVRSKQLSPITVEFCQRYRRDEVSLRDDEVMHVLSIPMWIEAAIAQREGIVQSREQFDLAMRGGLGFDPSKSWLEFFEQLGSEAMLRVIKRWSPRTAAMTSPPEILEALASTSPIQVMDSVPS